MDLPPGARLAVTGPSGCGKTTLLMTLAGLLPPRLGRVELNGTPIDVLAESELRRAVCFFAEDATFSPPRSGTTCWSPAATAATTSSLRLCTASASVAGWPVYPMAWRQC
ncbi:aBC superfamily ATP binding cassette transporter, ABC protein [Mycobacterium xenopi 3993]|nr:aBC superfamily ATP binding cassette transporter, ABC protein [Mycobacterium xenopi 3993]